MATLSNLYPPIVLDVLPAFIRTNDCKIYFSFSKYNSRENIQSVQISLINQRTNTSAFRADWYPTGVKITDAIGYDPDHGDYNYYVTINQKDLVNSDLGTDRIFGPNQFYKIQLRFTEKGFIPPKKEIDGNSFYEASANWLYENRNHFSEWSKVCLIKGISEPILQIHGFNNVISDNQETIFTSPIIDVIGELQIDSNENEYLKSYNIKIYQTENQNNILLDSGQIYTNSYNPNEINYEITYNLLDGVKYTLSITYTTNNLYSNTINYNFTVIQYNIVEKLNADIIATPDEENGRMKVDIIAKDTSDFIGSFTIRRSSSESNFHTWEDVKTITYETRGILNYTWYDITIKSGVWYKYCAQRRNSVGDRSVIIQTVAPKMCLFNDMFLTAGDRQLRIKFNPSLNEFKYNVSESQQVTIGSKFPYIKRNGANYFRTFPLGGLISSFMDTSNWYDPHYYDGEFHPEENEIKAFSSKAAIYGSNQEYYNQYNNQNNISEYNDYIYEREFREKVYDFLYQHSVKLFRSTTEGNILIKLMNIDFQPIESLGRRLYSFTATAVEVDEANISNYDKYNIQKIGEYDTYILYQHEVLGQISGTFTQGDGDILSGKINSKHSFNATEGFINKISGLKSLKLEIESEPYVIIEDGTGKLIKANSNSDIDINNATQGYIVMINGQEIIIPSRMIRYSKNPGDTTSIPEIIYSNFFELKENNTLITSLSFKYPTTATIDYTAILDEIEDTSKLTSEVYYYHKIGQLYDVFNPQDSLIQKIYNKYLINSKKHSQRLANITGIKIESYPGAIVYVKDSKDDDFNRHVLENGFLQLINDEINIEGLYFYGIHLQENSTDSNPRNNEYKLIKGQYQSFSEIQNPIANGVYKVSSYIANNAFSFNKNKELLTIGQNSIIKKVNEEYILLMEELQEESGNLYIYYNGKWCLFNLNSKTSGGDVMCSIEGMVDYFCEVIREDYRNVT